MIWVKKNWKRKNDGQFEIQGQKERDLTEEINLRPEKKRITNRRKKLKDRKRETYKQKEGNLRTERKTYAQKGRLTYRMTNIESKQTERRVIKV